MMPSPVQLMRSWFFLGTAFVQWAQSTPLLDRRADACPGYKASNVKKIDGGITADLSLAGTACNVYGNDLKDLKFVAEYQTGKLRTRS